MKGEKTKKDIIIETRYFLYPTCMKFNRQEEAAHNTDWNSCSIKAGKIGTDGIIRNIGTN